MTGGARISKAANIRKQSATRPRGIRSTLAHFPAVRCGVWRVSEGAISVRLERGVYREVERGWQIDLAAHPDHRAVYRLEFQAPALSEIEVHRTASGRVGLG